MGLKRVNVGVYGVFVGFVPRCDCMNQDTGADQMFMSMRMLA